MSQRVALNHRTKKSESRRGPIQEKRYTANSERWYALSLARDAFSSLVGHAPQQYNDVSSDVFSGTR
ncbi:hypothetical protein PV328_006799 [Microctonus aethiopoides]|uniref:Uncharacterized protein n=1 Tax=Microctonus aethiopoides TaxID=144406 RepID=A0AA39KTR7_9HYME|nr:hypothetical protein PV328_006799 [Microctonus aethiopoides]